MARLILKSPYLQPGGKKSPGGYLKYIATREGVEMAEDTSRHLSATAEQQKQIKALIKKHPQSKESHEYEDYLANPTRGNADAFLWNICEEYQDGPKRDVYLKYIDERPGSNGLFTDEGVPIVLSQVQKEMNEHPGNIWTHIISLRREDAERLGYNNPDAWMHLLRSQRNMIAQQMKIRPENFRWYAAFHSAGHHPHVHMMAYSIKPTEPYLTEKGIATIKSNLAQEIFRQDLLQIYQKQSDLRDELRQESRDRITEIVDAINHGSFDNPQMQMMLVQLADRLAKAKGKKQYGYLNAGTKKLVDAIVAELAGDSRIQELYSLWYEQKEDVLRTYTNKMPDRIPLEQEKEFKTIRNAVVQAALKIDPPPIPEQSAAAEQHIDTPETFDISAVRFAEETPESAPEESPPSRHSRPRVGFSNWWSDEYKLARLKQAGGKDSPPIPEEAYQLMLAEAEKGNGLAMHDVGKMLLTGQGCDQDAKAAQEWFQKAYDAFFQMEQSARDPGYWQYRLGKMHAMGYGVEQNYEDAAEWYEQAGEWRNPFAAYALGSMYHYGQVVEKDEEKAFRYFKIAAEHPSKPNAYAQCQPGRMCVDAPEEAERWYRLAYQGFLRIEQEMPDDKLYYRLGSMNLHGVGTEKNLDLAREYLHKAAIMGNVDAVYGMGKLYLESDIQKAIAMFELAAEQGNTYAEYQLGKLYCFGQGVPQNLEVGMDEWFENVCKIKVRPSSHQTYRGYIDHHVAPNIGKIPLEKLSTMDLQKLYRKLMNKGRVERIEAEHQPKGLSAKTVRNINQVISSAMDFAVAQKIISENPCKAVALPKLEHKEMQTIPAEQLQAFLQEAKATGVYEMYYIELATGLRRGELLGLKWTDIDWKNGIIKVRRQVARVNGEIVEAPLKTKNSYRAVSISPQAIEVLREQKRKTNDTYVFPSPNGGPISPDSVNNMLGRVLERAGIPKVRFHDLRHTFATIALQNGVDIKTVSGMLGHFSAGFTLDTYAHVTTSAQKEAAQTMGNVLSM